MTDLTTPAVRPAAAQSLPSRLAGIIRAPTSTFADISASPRWPGALTAVTLVCAVLWFWLGGTETGQLALFDQQERRIEAWGGTMTEAQRLELEGRLPSMGIVLGATQLAGIPAAAFLLSGLLFGVFTGILGGPASYRQVLAVVAHSGAIRLVHQCIAVPLAYIRESLTSPTTLAVFAPFVDEGGFAARLLGAIDLFVVWWLIVLAIGLGVVYQRRARAILWPLLGVYLVIAVVIAVVMRAAAGS